MFCCFQKVSVNKEKKKNDMGLLKKLKFWKRSAQRRKMLEDMVAALQDEVQDLKERLEEKHRDRVEREAMLQHEIEVLKRTFQRKELSAQDEIKTLKKRLEERDIRRVEAEAHRTTFSRWKRFFFGLLFVENHHEDMQQMKNELDAVKDANSKLQKHLASTVKSHQMEKRDLMRQNEDLKKELEAATTMVPASTSELAGSRSRPQGHLCRNHLDSFQPVRMLGEGAFAKVVLAKKKAPDGSEQLFALKALTSRNFRDDKKEASIYTEKMVMILASDHPFITTLHSCFRAKGSLFFVMSYESGGSLETQLQKEQVFTEKTAQFYVAEITLALEFLHEHGILHRDLKPANILIGADGHCKVADFGLSASGIFRRNKTSEPVGTLSYMAPEMLRGVPYGHEVDWWALGVTMFKMLTGRVPFCEPDTRFLVEKIVHHEVEYPRRVSEVAKTILRKLLAKDPAQRLGTYGGEEKVRQQPFFNGIDWHALQKKRVKPPRKIEAVKETQGTLTFDDLFEHNENTMNRQGKFEGFSHGVT